MNTIHADKPALLERLKLVPALLLLTVTLSNAIRGDSASLEQTTGTAMRKLELRDIDDRVIAPFKAGSAKATVFVFVSTDCPISNRYAPEVRRLHEKFSPRGVTFWLVYPNKSESAETIRQHLKDYRYPCGALRDLNHELVRAAGARVTPEAAVFGSDSKLIYHGRIDDWYVDFGKARPAPTQRDLEVVLEGIVSGRPVTRASAPAVGCYISD